MMMLRRCMQTIMFTICTASIKANLSQALQLGPNRAMQVFWRQVRVSFAAAHSVVSVVLHVCMHKASSIEPEAGVQVSGAQKMMMTNQKHTWDSSQNSAKTVLGTSS